MWPESHDSDLLAKMDIGESRQDDHDAFEEVVHPRMLPHDLPTSLNDRRPVRSYGGETEMWDAWQGMDEGG